MKIEMKMYGEKFNWILGYEISGKFDVSSFNSQKISNFDLKP